MKKIYSLILISFFITASFAQNEFVNDGATVTVQDGALLFVNGEIKTNTGSTLNNDGVIELTGDWEFNGTAVHNAGTSGERLVRFNDPTANYETQTVRGNGNIYFFNVEIVNDAIAIAGDWFGGVELESDITIGNEIDFLSSNAKIYIGDRVLTMENSLPTAFVNASNQRYIQTDGSGLGGLKWKVDANETYLFPIGTRFPDLTDPSFLSSNYAPFEIALSTLGDNVDYLTARFNHVNDPGAITGSNPSYGTAWGGSFDCTPYGLPSNQQIVLSDMAQDYGIWEIEPDGSSSSGWGDYDITFYPDVPKLTAPTPNSGFVMFKALKAPSAFNFASDNWGDYVLPESGEPCAATDAAALIANPSLGVTAIGMNSFSKFALAGNEVTALPVELLYLKADPINNEFIRVHWSTAVEIDNAGFYLERSTDGVDFEEISWISGNGNTSQEMYYSYNDLDVEHNVVYYYRLRQVDFDGSYEYTYIVNAMISTTDVFNISEFIPNPTNEHTRVVVNSSTDREITVTIFNTLGQLVKDEVHHIAPGQYSIDFNMQHLADGTYHAVFRTQNEIHNRKLIITK
ncbi:MAG: T9SS C-terminal target domain-containing protein [Chitinophagaceae bacterium]|nr:MAG: T9SS C-terminal target domain-containing protein [Chitinophagaceae bacterium]